MVESSIWSCYWQSQIDLQLNDIGFTYQLDLQSDLKYLATLPTGEKVIESGSSKATSIG